MSEPGLQLDISRQKPPRTVILMGPVFDSEAVGGLQLAIADVVGQLELRGWRVHQAIGGVRPQDGDDRRAGEVAHTRFRSGLARLASNGNLFTLWHRLPLAMRKAVAALFMPRNYYANGAETLRAADRVLDTIDQRVPVLLFIDGAVPGLAALATRRHRNTVIVSLNALAMELRAHWWWLARQCARLRLGGKSHSDLYRQVSVGQVRRAVFASRYWQQEAVSAGLPKACARSIYFGIPQGPPVNGPARCHGTRLLWLGRLTPDKGLHLLLPCLRDIREQVPGVTLAAYAAQGQPEYRDRVMALVAQHKLQDIVTFHEPVPRSSLPSVYRDHDALFFYSRYPEPVALTMMEACANGLPVLCSEAADDAALVQHDSTCWCYAPDDTATIIAGAVRVLTDGALRGRLAHAARELIADTFSLEAMGRRYDALLGELDHDPDA